MGAPEAIRMNPINAGPTHSRVASISSEALDSAVRSPFGGYIVSRRPTRNNGAPNFDLLNAGPILAIEYPDTNKARPSHHCNHQSVTGHRRVRRLLLILLRSGLVRQTVLSNSLDRLHKHAIGRRPRY